jgi:hypothetical protein
MVKYDDLREPLKSEYDQMSIRRITGPFKSHSGQMSIRRPTVILKKSNFLSFFFPFCLSPVCHYFIVYILRIMFTFYFFPVILDFIKNIVRFVLILPAILDVQSSLLSINMRNGFFHVKNFLRFKFNQYIYILYLSNEYTTTYRYH